MAFWVARRHGNGSPKLPNRKGKRFMMFVRALTGGSWEDPVGRAGRQHSGGTIRSVNLKAKLKRLFPPSLARKVLHGH